MKKLAITLLSVAAATTMYGQGNFNFNDTASAAAITIGTVNAGSAEGLAGQFVGTGYSASFFYGAPGSTGYSNLTYFANANTVFFGNGVADADQSGGAGIFDGGNVVVPGLSTSGVIGVAVWWSGPGANGVATSYAQALADGYNTGLSPLLTIPLATGVQFPVALDGLASFTVGTTPEPTTLALCGLGAASLLLFRRKKK
jgi:hypothetical protein